MAEIVTITANPALDLSTEAPALLPDHKLRCTAPRVQPGGGGVNVSRAIAALGGASRALVAYGGHTGEHLMQLLAGEGLGVESLGVGHTTRQSMSVRDAASGLQYRFMIPGAPWSERDCDTARDAIRAAVTPGALLIPSGSLPPGMPFDFFLTLNDEVAAQGGRMIIDTSGPALERAAKGGAGLWCLRMDTVEAEELAGRRLHSLDDMARMASGLRAAGAGEIVMIAAGAQGTVVACEGWLGLTRPPVVVPHSLIGAGDSFIGAFALAISRGEDPVDACARGTAAAASAVTMPGTDLCARDDVDRFYRQVTRHAL
ncbi:6-phosphofructokinase [Hasllibacter halocynthiae]|uniref:Phosphofructokinase n=1 Tax=Hasllibacter halocynthiae TaxID=595589 RepID=A0A2T0X3J0_9RHOB|nr:PfkB family carbohydrate kinase [Hasllibacter halocynthiae]PRY93500.1 6-phosphofructokinase [Hasllibacter halocynthiae]